MQHTSEHVDTKVLFSPFILHGYCISNVSKLAVFEDQKVVLLSNLQQKDRNQLNKGFLDWCHCNFASLEKRHYYSSIWKHAIIILL